MPKTFICTRKAKILETKKMDFQQMTPNPHRASKEISERCKKETIITILIIKNFQLIIGSC